MTKPPLPLDERPTIKSEWEDFAKIIPAHAPARQREEMRKAFYGGAVAMFAMVTGHLDGGTEPTANDLAYMDRISNEIKTYGNAIARETN